PRRPTSGRPSGRHTGHRRRAASSRSSRLALTERASAGARPPACRTDARLRREPLLRRPREHRRRPAPPRLVLAARARRYDVLPIAAKAHAGRPEHMISRRRWATLTTVALVAISLGGPAGSRAVAGGAAGQSAQGARAFAIWIVRLLGSNRYAEAWASLHP